MAKVISSNISLEDYEVLERYAKLYYNRNKLKQPTISHLVRHLLNGWANRIRVDVDASGMAKVSVNFTAEFFSRWCPIQLISFLLFSNIDPADFEILVVFRYHISSAKYAEFLLKIKIDSMNLHS